MEHLYGTDVWQFRADKPEETTIFNAAMSAMAISGGTSMLRRPD